jgi:hypothetical protein
MFTSKRLLLVTVQYIKVAFPKKKKNYLMFVWNAFRNKKKDMELLEHNRLYAMEKREVDEMIEHKVSLIIIFSCRNLTQNLCLSYFFIFFTSAPHGILRGPSVTMTCV